jgi:hypothetical protein
MSVISNRHTVVPFVAGTTQPFAEQRLAKIGYKKTTKIPNPLPSIAVSVPAITSFDETIIERALPFIVTMFENAQDGIIRSLNDSSAGTLKEISDDDISPEACLRFMEAEANGSRLTKEIIGSWFDTEVADSLTILVLERMKIDNPTKEQEAMAAGHVKIYRDLIASLAGGKTFIPEHLQKQCRVAIAFASSETDIGDRLIARLDAMSAPKETQNMLSLCD